MSSLGDAVVLSAQRMRARNETVEKGDMVDEGIDGKGKKCQSAYVSVKWSMDRGVS